MKLNEEICGTTSASLLKTSVIWLICGRRVYIRFIFVPQSMKEDFVKLQSFYLLLFKENALIGLKMLFAGPNLHIFSSSNKLTQTV